MGGFTIDPARFKIDAAAFGQQCADEGIPGASTAPYYLLPEACTFLDADPGACPNARAFLRDWVRWTTPRGGFYSWLTLQGVNGFDLAGRAVEQGVAVVPGKLFFPDERGADTMRLSFSMVDEEHIDEGIARLGALL